LKQAYVLVTNIFLRLMLKLPETVEVRAIIIDREDFQRDMFTVFLEGDGLPDFTEVKRGDLIPKLNFVYEKGPICPTCGMDETSLKEIGEAD